MTERTRGILGSVALALGFVLTGTSVAPTGAEERALAPVAPDVRYVVIHRPGPAWRKGVDPREQPGIGAHVAHYRKLQAEGRLELGGPFLDAQGGGMMVPAAGQSETEVRAFAAADPAVAAGLLEFEVRPWYVAMKRGA